MGHALANNGHWDQAGAEFDRAIELDVGAWRARCGQAECLLRQGSCGAAVAAMQHAMNQVPEHARESVYYRQLALYSLSSGDYQRAWKAATEAYNLDSVSLEAQHVLLEALLKPRSGNAEFQDLEALRFLEKLHSSRTKSAMSRLVKLFLSEPFAYRARVGILDDPVDVWENSTFAFGPWHCMLHNLAMACEGQGRPIFMLEALDDAVAMDKKSDARNKQNYELANMAAWVGFHSYRRDSEAIQLWEESLIHLSASWQQGAYEEGIECSMRAQLATIYFDRAVEARQAWQDSSIHLDKLAWLCNMFEDPHCNDWEPSYATLLMASWDRDFGFSDSETWQEPFRAFFRSASAEVANDDSSASEQVDDERDELSPHKALVSESMYTRAMQHAWMLKRLLQALIMVGDEISARTLFAVIHAARKPWLAYIQRRHGKPKNDSPRRQAVSDVVGRQNSALQSDSSDIGDATPAKQVAEQSFGGQSFEQEMPNDTDDEQPISIAVWRGKHSSTPIFEMASCLRCKVLPIDAVSMHACCYCAGLSWYDKCLPLLKEAAQWAAFAIPLTSSAVSGQSRMWNGNRRQPGHRLGK